MLRSMCLVTRNTVFNKQKNQFLFYNTFSNFRHKTEVSILGQTFMFLGPSPPGLMGQKQSAKLGMDHLIIWRNLPPWLLTARPGRRCVKKWTKLWSLARPAHRRWPFTTSRTSCTQRWRPGGPRWTSPARNGPRSWRSCLECGANRQVRNWCGKSKHIQKSIKFVNQTPVCTCTCIHCM